MNEKLKETYLKDSYRKKRGFLILNKEHLLELMKKYKTDPKIAEVLGCSKQNVELYRRKWGVSHSKRPPSIKDHIIEALNKSPYMVTSAELYKKLKCTRLYICYIARIYNLPLKKNKSTGIPSKIKEYLSKEKLKELQDKYGVDKNIAKFLKVSTPYVCYLRNKYGIKSIRIHSKIKEYFNREKLKELQDIYGVDKNIAKFLKVSTPYVCYLRNKYGVKSIG